MVLGRPPGRGIGAVALDGDLAGRNVRALALLGEPRPAIDELRPALPRLREAIGQVTLDLVDARELAAERFDPLGHRRHVDPTGRELGAERGLVRLGALDRVPDSSERSFERALGVSRDRDTLAEPRQGRARLFGLARDLTGLALDRLDVALHAGMLLPGSLDVLVPRETLGQARLHGARELADLLAKRRELGPERRDLVLAGLDDRGEPLDLSLQLAQLPLAGQQRMLGLSRRPRPAAVEPADRAEDLAARRDVGRDHAVAAPELLRLVQMPDEGDLPQQMVNESRHRRADLTGDPAHADVVLRARVGPRREMLERQEGRRAERVPVQKRHGRPRVREPLDDDPLQPLAQHRLDGALHARRHFEQVGDRAHDAGERLAPVVGEHRADAGAVAFPRTLELGQRLEARAPRRQLDARVGQLRLGLGQTALGSGFLRLEPLALLLQGHELGGGPIARGRQGTALAGEALGFRLRLRELAGEPFGAASELDLALAQLAGAAHEVDALGGQPRLLEAQRLRVIALEREGRAMPLERALELRRGARALGGDLLGVAECLPHALALADDRRLALGGRAHLLVESQALLAELADLHAHLLAALEEPLELSLHLRDSLAQIGQPVLALLERFARLGLVRRQRRQARAQAVLAVAQPRQLARQALALAAEPGEVRSDERQT